jgi:hypothetical protein
MDFLYLRRRIETAFRLIRHDRSFFLQKTGLARIPKSISARHARKYLASVGAESVLVKGDASEFSLSDAKAVDLSNLHRLVRRKRPSNVIEFGCGFSTLDIAHALDMNGQQWGAHGKLHVLESHDKWAENVRRKIPPHLASLIDLRVQQAEVIYLGAQLCHAFPNLPNVRPDLIYVDGPDVDTVSGTNRGISFGRQSAASFACSADPLFYEWCMYPGATILVDGRYTNVEFLRANLKRLYRVRTHLIHDFTSFELRR